MATWKIECGPLVDGKRNVLVSGQEVADTEGDAWSQFVRAHPQLERHPRMYQTTAKVEDGRKVRDSGVEITLVPEPSDPIVHVEPGSIYTAGPIKENE